MAGSTYEAIRDATSGELGAAWKAADREAAYLQEKYRELKDDPNLSDEGRASEAWRLYESYAGSIAKHKQQTRELLDREARDQERFSIPRPKGETLVITNPQTLLAAQNEAGRILRKAERLKNNPAVAGRGMSGILTEEYGRGLRVGGVEGVAVCKGALFAAEELGVPHEHFLNDLRSPEQLGHLESSQRYQRMQQLIAKKTPEPPFRKPGKQAGASKRKTPWWQR